MNRFLPILATLLVCAAVLSDKVLLHPGTEVADYYHEDVAGVINALPMHHGDWLGTDVPVPSGAMKLLKPNAILCRRFQNMRTGESVIFILVHVRDARDVLGHYPPVCYTGQGWVLTSSSPMDWARPEGSAVTGTQYFFRRQSLDRGSAITIDNFLLLRGGVTCRDMDAVEAVATDRTNKLYGAAQFQLIYDQSYSAQKRQQITRQFLEYAAPAFETISSLSPEKVQR